MLHLAADLAVVASLATAAATLIPASLPLPVSILLWTCYALIQGAFMTGLWVLAHECGHGAFSRSCALNDAVGFAVHSLLLVPYFSWKHSHRRHHSNTGSTTKDEVFVPPAGDPDAPRTAAHRASRTPVGRAAGLLFALTLGWPAYLFTNASGRKYEGAGWVSHFNPWAPIFSERERAGVAASGAALAGVIAGLAALARVFGVARVALLYGAPLGIVNALLVLITLLQHTHSSLPHYGDEDWEWLRGALSTVDRSFGPVLDHILHHISDTHVLHHICSSVPHYHAVEATAALTRVLGPYHAVDTRPIWKAAWADWRDCHIVAPAKGAPAGDHGALWFHP